MKNIPTIDDFNLGLFVLRLIIGPVFAFHGYAKITRGGKLDGTAAWFDSMGMRPGKVHARMAAGGEILTGAAITFGFLTTLGGLGLVALMTVAWYTVHRGNGLLITSSGWEYNLVLGAVGVALATLGAGEWSVDNAVGIDLNGSVGFGIALVGGLAAAFGLLAACYRPPAKTD